MVSLGYSTKSLWKIIKKDLMAAVKSFFIHGKLFKELNHTNLVLIPKVDNPNEVSQLRPISLFNVCYKIIAKILANRLKSILPSIISPYQFAFIPG